ncbi:MAG: hypothetical protein V8S99_11235 [Oscillospiraceae bacterium]
MAEAYARGKQKALAAGVKPPLCIVVQQVGRLDDYLRDVAQDMKLGLDESVITMAGLAVSPSAPIRFLSSAAMTRSSCRPAFAALIT